jgi:HK97 family phage major capsid protein
MSMKLFELRGQRAKVLDAADAILKKAETEKRQLTTEESQLVDLHMEKVTAFNAMLKPLEAANSLAAMVAKDPTILFAGEKRTRENGGLSIIPGRDVVSPEIVEQLKEDLGCFYRMQPITATDSPLFIGSGGLSGTVPTQILASLPTYYNLNSFALAGATVYPTDNTDPLVKPVISAGVAPDAVSEGASATDSHPMQVDTFTFHGQKYSRLVKASEEALMNTALSLPNEITGELTAAVANAFTATITTAMMAALQANPTTFVDSGSSDPYYSINALINAVPPRFDTPGACFMGSRADRLKVTNARDTYGRPLFSPVDGTVLGKRWVINDNLSRVVYGDFSAGVFIRQSPFFLQILLEAFTATGERGFKATQWLDQHFLAEKTTIASQPLYFTHLDVAGS